MQSMLLFVSLLTCASGLQVEVKVNPITRVAELLEGLANKVKADGDAEQDLYDHYKCWCTKVINAKTTSTANNEARISELAAYIDDLTNGRVELTSERSTLETEIKELEKAIAEAEALREKEHEDYLAAKDEMEKAIAALEGAVSTLNDATADHKEGAALAHIKSNLKHIMQVGNGFLAKRDVSELAKVLDVPDVDYEKLNQPATHKQKYSARSTKIQDILADMLTTFEDNLSEANSAEEKTVSDFTALDTAKKDQLGAAKQALLDKSGENGARAEALATSESEKSDLEGQNSRDVTFLADTKTACDAKEAAWSERKRLRAEEIASIGQAIATLRSDDARDLMNKSFDSQGFIQLSKPKLQRRGHAMAMLRKTAITSKDSRLAALVTTLSARQPEELENEANPFTDVIAAVDQMVTDLKAEEADDLAKKEQCESERQENTQEAKMLSKKIDTNTETIDRLVASIAAANKQIEEVDSQVADLGVEKRDAGDQRAKEATEHATAKTDDEGAIGLIETAIGVLQDFYTRNGLSLAQVKVVKQEPFVEAGEAPTPPPSTFEGEYGGSKGENQGIVAIMELIKQDIEKDITKSDSEETDAIAAHDSLNADIDATVAALGLTKADLEGSVANDEGAMTAEKTTRTTNQGDLTSTLDFLKEIAPGCDFIAVNFQTRLTNRQAEMDGLSKAKAILEGASFD